MSHISIYTKLSWRRSEGKPHAAVDVLGTGDVHFPNAPVFDRTARWRLETEGDFD